jgi:thiamine kinase
MPEVTPGLDILIGKIEPLRGAVVLEKLAGGPASDSWLLSAGDEKFVARLDKPLSRRLGLDRYAELEILETVSAVGIGPQVIWSDPENGVLISSYIPGCAWSSGDVHDLVRLEKLAVTLRRLHSLPPRGPAFEPGKKAQAYARVAGTETADTIAAQAAKQAEMLYSNFTHPAICHNDLVHSNIIGTGTVRLIDWEYAAVGDPGFDLAIVVRHHQLKLEQTESFLCAYYDAPGKEHFSRLESFCRLYDQLAALWYLSVIGQTGQDANFEEELKRILARL